MLTLGRKIAARWGDRGFPKITTGLLLDSASLGCASCSCAILNSAKKYMGPAIIFLVSAMD